MEQGLKKGPTIVVVEDKKIEIADKDENPFRDALNDTGTTVATAVAQAMADHVAGKAPLPSSGGRRGMGRRYGAGPLVIERT